MIRPTQVAAFVIGTMLSASMVQVGFDPAKAGSSTAPSEQLLSPPVAGQAAIEPRGRVYLFRGALGPFFSRGMDHLTDKTEHAGFIASVDEFTICRLIAAKAIRQYHEDPAPIILIGHSMGGYCAVIFAEVLQAENIPVSLVVAIDPAHATHSVPLNVERFINIFLSKSVLGGGDVKPLAGYQGHYASFDLSEHDEVTHINIEKMEQVHAQLLTNIAQLARTPPKGGGAAVPLRYDVPAEAEIELMDSGTPVLAGPRATLPALALYLAVP